MVELLFAIVIFSVLALTISRMTSGSGHLLKLSANSFQGFQLGSKVMEDVVEEGRINGDLLSVSSRFPEMIATDSVLNAQSVYFRYFKDRAEPWGVIQPAEGGILPADGALFPTLKTFRSGMSAKRNTPTEKPGWERNLCTVEVLTEWQEQDGAKRQYLLPIYSPCPWGPAATETALILPEDILRSRIREILFPDLPNRTFDQAVAEKGADPDLVFHVGKIAVYTDALGASMTELTKELKEMEKRRKTMIAAPSHDLVNLQIKMTRMMEGAASLVFFALSEVSPSIRELDRIAAAGNLPKIPENQYKKCLGAFPNRAREVEKWLKASKDSYEWLLHPGFKLLLTGREKELVRAKILEAFRAMTALSFLPKEKYRDFIRSETAFWEGKNPSLHRLYLAESALCDDVERLKTAFPNLTAIVRNFNDEIKPCAALVPGLTSRYPAAP